MEEKRNDRFNPSTAWILALVAVVALGVAIAMLSPRGRVEAAIGTPGTPVVLVLSKEHGADLSDDRRQALAAFVQAETGLTTEVRVAQSALDGIQAFEGAADVGLLNIFEYLLARKEYGVEATLQVLRRHGDSTYQGEILVPAGSAAKAIGDLAGKKVAYVDRFSSSGFVFPAKILADAGVRVVPDFAGSHGEALERVREGRADAAATYASAAAGDPALRSLARSEPIPNEPVFFRPKLAADKRDKLRAALRKYPATPGGKTVFADIADITGLQEVEDAAYLPVLAAIRAAGEKVYDVVPEGDIIEARQRGIDIIP